MAYSDRELLARLIECEAGGEEENGMKAVAGVVNSIATSALLNASEYISSALLISTMETI